MMMWVQIEPNDDWSVVADGKCDGDCVQTRDYVMRVEHDLGLLVSRRLCDPNMGASPSGQRREVTWQDEFTAAGLHCELADDTDVGRGRVNTFLKMDPDTSRPRLRIHARCRDTVYQMNRYVWADYSKSVDRDIKQTPRDTNDDFPTLLKYLANAEPTFTFLKGGAPVIGNTRRRLAQGGH